MLVPILHLEEKLQLKDLTRFDASKSILVKGTVNPINSIKIKPGADASEVEVFNAVPKNWYLDWAFKDYAFDVDATNEELVFEANGLSYTTNVVNGTYTLANLLVAIKNAIEAIASPLSVSITVDYRNRITIAPSTPLNVLPNNTSKGLLVHLGFSEDGQLVSAPVEYGVRKVTLKVSSISENESISHYVKVYSQSGDALFSQDSDLVSEENDIMKWLPVGRSSYLNLHRTAQTQILDWLDRNGYVDDSGKKITKFAVVDKSDVNIWSKYLTLRLFFMGANNQVDDTFKEKAKYYEKLEIEARNRAILNFDLDGDGKAEQVQGPDIGSGRLYLR